MTMRLNLSESGLFQGLGPSTIGRDAAVLNILPGSMLIVYTPYLILHKIDNLCPYKIGRMEVYFI